MTRSGHAGQRCWKYDWIIDLDVQKFFDEVPWDLMVQCGAGGHRLPAGCCCTSSGGWLRRCSTRTGPLSSTRELRKVGGFAGPGEPVHALRV